MCARSDVNQPQTKWNEDVDFFIFSFRIKRIQNKTKQINKRTQNKKQNTKIVCNVWLLLLLLFTLCCACIALLCVSNSVVMFCSGSFENSRAMCLVQLFLA